MRVAIVLAAGASRRMRRPKLELELGGKTLIERSVQNLLDASVDRVRLVVPPGSALASMKDLDVIRNPNRDEGLSSSLRAGLRGLPKKTRVVLVALADKPLVKPETIKKLLDVFEEGGAKVVYPVYRGEQGHPVLWDAALVDELSRVEGDRGAKSMLEAHRSEALAVPVDDVGVCFDIDTPEDYAAALELL
jgi:CTP:molybdopterin cytidylyltransferase MocA